MEEFHLRCPALLISRWNIIVLHFGIDILINTHDHVSDTHLNWTQSYIKENHTDIYWHLLVRILNPMNLNVPRKVFSAMPTVPWRYWLAKLFLLRLSYHIWCGLRYACADVGGLLPIIQTSEAIISQHLQFFYMMYMNRVGVLRSTFNTITESVPLYYHEL